MKENSDKRNPFVVPTGYLESFPAQMMARIDALEESKHASQGGIRIHYADRIRRYTRYAVGVAATVAFFLVFTHKAPDTPAATTAPAEVSMNFVAANSSDQMYDYMLLTTNDVYNYASSLE